MLVRLRFSRLGQRIASLALVAFAVLTGLAEQVAGALHLNPLNTVLLVGVAVIGTSVSTALVITGDPFRRDITDSSAEEPPP